MVKKQWKIYAGWIALCEAVGIIAGLLSRHGIEFYHLTAQKPPFSPPAWGFPVVWTVLFALMGICAARVSLAGPSRRRDIGLNLFTAQLVVNFFWPLFFFNLGIFNFALIWLVLLWLLVFAVIILFAKVDVSAAWLLVPYLIWLTFAAYLNSMAVLLNG